MEQKFYHPVTGDIVTGKQLEDSYNLDSLFIGQYDFRPREWNFFFADGENRETTRTFGIEIELNIGTGDYRYEKSRDYILLEVCKLFNKNGRHIHIMYDGSLRNGFEIVTAPMSLRYILETFDIEEINSTFRKLGLYASYDCGLHIHVGYLSSEFNSSRLKNLQDNVLRLFNITLPLWTSIGNRSVGYQGNRYAHTKFFTEPNTKQHIYLMRTHKSLLENGMSSVNLDIEQGELIRRYNKNDRYQAVNLTNSNTIEFRLFKGTHNWNTILEYLMFVALFMNVASRENAHEIIKLTDFVELTDCKRHVANVVRDMKRYSFLYNRGLAGSLPELDLDLTIYQRPTKHVSVGNYIMRKEDWETYVDNIILYNLAKKQGISENKQIWETNAYSDLTINFEDFIYRRLREIISVGDTKISSVSVSRGSSSVLTQNRGNLDGFVVLYGIPRDFFSNMGISDVEIMKR